MIIPYLCFHGRCEEAVTYYGERFGFKPELLKFSTVPQRGFEVPQEMNEKIMFTRFLICGNPIMACDHYPGLETKTGQSMSINLVGTKEELEFAFSVLSKDGQVGMPFQKTLWSSWYASCIDKFQVVWQFSLNE